MRTIRNFGLLLLCSIILSSCWLSCTSQTEDVQYKGEDGLIYRTLDDEERIVWNDYLSCFRNRTDYDVSNIPEPFINVSTDCGFTCGAAGYSRQQWGAETLDEPPQPVVFAEPQGFIHIREEYSRQEDGELNYTLYDHEFLHWLHYKLIGSADGAHSSTWWTPDFPCYPEYWQGGDG